MKDMMMFNSKAEIESFLEKLKADMQAPLEAAKERITQEIAEAAKRQSKVRCDVQGRFVVEPEEGVRYFISTTYGCSVTHWHNESLDKSLFSLGQTFISRPAAEAEAVRLQCLQRLRGMPGYSLNQYSGHPLWFLQTFVCAFDTDLQCEAALLSFTPAERAAFTYREPGHDK